MPRYMRRMNILLLPSIQHLDISTMFIDQQLLGPFIYRFYIPRELEIKDTTEPFTPALYLDALSNIDARGKVATQLYDKRDDFNFTIINLTYICSNTHLSPAHGVYSCISQLIGYARACSTYNLVLSRGRLLTDTLLLQRFLQSRLMSAFRKLYHNFNYLIYNYKLSFSHILSDIFHTNI
jgi:hypothetical protein